MIATAPSPTSLPSPPRPSRLAALDVCRGLLLVVSVIVDSWVGMPAWIGHPAWDGVHPLDFLFPAFATLSGAGMGIAYARRVRPAREVRRVLVLLTVGVAFGAVEQVLVEGHLDVRHLRWTGVLQLYAGLVLVMAVLGRVVRAWWGWLVAAAVVAVTYTAVLGGWAAGCPGGVLSRECNPSRVIDVAVFGADHVYALGRAGHDPEGLLVLMGALVSAALGACAGRITLDHQRGGSRMALVRASAALVVGGLVVGCGTAMVVEPFKRLWTPPFACLVSTVVTVVFLATHVLLDTRTAGTVERRMRYPLVALGRNSLGVYFGSNLVGLALLVRGPEGGRPAPGRSFAELAQSGAAEMVGRPGAVWPWCLCALLAWTALAMVLHARRVYIRA